MNRKKAGLVLMSLVLVGGILAACGSKNESNSGASNESSSNGQKAEQVFRMNLSTEPPSLDPATSQDTTSGTVLSGLMEGLTRMNEAGLPEPAMAESWDVSEDGKTYTFHLHPDLKWSNGDPLTAGDFEYSWKRTLDPKTLAPYASQLYYIKGAEAYNTAEEGQVDPSTVGVKAIDDLTLQVELENPTAYFLSLMAFYTYFPVDQKIVENDEKWATEAKSYVSNGPFKMATWKHSDSIELVTNENYYDKENVKLTKVKFFMVKDSNTELSMYKTDKLDYAGQPTGSIPADQLVLYRDKQDPELHTDNIASMYYYLLNPKVKPFDNANIRKALAMTINRQQLIDKVIKGGQTAAFGIVPPGIAGVSGDYRSEVTDTEYFKEDLEEAKKLMAQGLQEEGLSSFPEGLTIAVNDTGQHKDIAEAVVDMWKTNLGVNIGVEMQEWKVFLENRKNGDYTVARAGWAADYSDPMTFMDVFSTGNGNNDSGFSNKEYDALIHDAYTSNDNTKREEDFHQAEKILIQDNMAVIPVYYYTNNALVKPNVKGLRVTFNGEVIYNWATVE